MAKRLTEDWLRELGTAFRNYGEHSVRCAARGSQPGDPRCDCGLKDVLLNIRSASMTEQLTPILVHSIMTGRVYIATDYEVGPQGQITASAKVDVTDKFERIFRVRLARMVQESTLAVNEEEIASVARAYLATFGPGHDVLNEPPLALATKAIEFWVKYVHEHPGRE